MVTNEKLQDLRGLLASATCRPWHIGCDNHCIENNIERIAEVGFSGNTPLIIAAVNILPDLLAENEHFEAQCKRLRGEAKKAYRNGYNQALKDTGNDFAEEMPEARGVLDTEPGRSTPGKEQP